MVNDKINISQRDGNVIYKLGRKIICYRHNCTYCIGKPSDMVVMGEIVESEEIAHERCIEICNDLMNTITDICKVKFS